MRFRLFLLLALLLSTTVSFAQDDPTTEINQLAETLHIQNLRTLNVTRWIGGDLGNLDGSQVGASAGSQLDNWTFQDLSNASMQTTVNDLERPVLINIWASWCGPCRFEFPFLTDYALNRETNYDLWFLNAGDTSVAAAERFLNTQADGITVWLDPNDQFINGPLDLRVFPTTILLDTDGTLLVAHSGVVTHNAMAFFDAVAANPELGSIDPSTIEIPDLTALIGPTDPAQASPIIYGQQTTGVIDDQNWRQDYRFEGSVGDEVVITMEATDEDLDAYLVLIGPDGERVAENDDSSSGSTDSEIRTTLPADGTYVVVATRFLEADGFGSGGFILQVRTSDQTAMDDSIANVLPINVPISGRLTFELKQNIFVLEATEGQTLTFTLEHDLPEEQLNLQVRLGANDRLVPYTRTEDGRLEVEVTVEVTGTYSVYVARSQSSRAGPITYSLTVTDGGDSPPTGPTPQTSRTIAYGETVTDMLSDETYEIDFTFEGNSGDVITIEMTADLDSGNLDTFLTLLSPNGDALAENDDIDLRTTDSAISEYMLPESGTYTIKASRYGGETGSSSGEFALTLTLVSAGDEPDIPPPDDGDTPLTYGSTVTGVIEGSTYRIPYNFEGNAGDRIVIEMNDVDDTRKLDAYLILTDETGEVLAENDDVDLNSTDSRIEFELPADGTYTIVATRYAEADGLSEGNFELSLALADQTVDIPDTSVLEYGSSVTGTISDETFEVLYTFEGRAGDTITIEMNAAESGNLDPLLSLLNAEGEVVAENDDFDLNSTDSRIEFELPADGTYTVVATRYSGANGVSEGEFTLSLQADDTVVVQPSDDSIEAGTTIDGTIDDDNFEVLYTFEGTAGEQVTIQLEATDGNLDPYLVLLGPDGEIVAENDDINFAQGNYNAAIEAFTLPETGTYTVVATRFNGQIGTTDGDFVLTLSETTTVATPTTASIDYEETLTGTIDDTTYEYRFEFQGNRSDAVTITMNATSGDLDTYLMLEDSDGNLLDLNDDVDLTSQDLNSAIESYSLPESGTYVIVATRFDGEFGTTSGDFELILTLTDGRPLDTAATLEYQDTVSGTIDNQNFEEQYSFTGRAGDLITIDMSAGDGNLDTSLTLIGPNGDELITNDDIDLENTDSAIVDFVLPETGTYTIVATRYAGASGLSEGDYTLSLTSADVAIAGGGATGASINYGDSVVGTISSDNLDDRYSFDGAAGDIITIEMDRTDGDLDAYISLLDADGNELAFNDDNIKTGFNQDAAILSFKLPEDGTYTIVATRYGVFYGPSSGDYELSLNVR